jgi:mono/diheme cytochrome c family protein
MTRILTAIAIIAMTGLASGDNCRQRVLVQYQQQAVIATYAAPAVLQFPLYSTGYAQDGQSTDKARLDALEAKIDLLLGRLNGQPGKQPGAAEQLPVPAKASGPGAGAAPHPALAVFAGKCASCHDRAGKVEGGFAMLERGQLLPWTVLQAGLVATRTYCGEMPPRGGLTNDEAGAIQEFVNAALKQARGQK